MQGFPRKTYVNGLSLLDESEVSYDDAALPQRSDQAYRRSKTELCNYGDLCENRFPG